MHDKSNQVPGEHDWRTERSLVLMVLSHSERCSRAILEAELRDIEPLTVSDALTSLGAEGVVSLDGDQVEASLCVWHLDTLGLIAV
jgi:hypothetical protein